MTAFYQNLNTLFEVSLGLLELNLDGYPLQEFRGLNRFDKI